MHQLHNRLQDSGASGNSYKANLMHPYACTGDILTHIGTVYIHTYMHTYMLHAHMHTHTYKHAFAWVPTYSYTHTYVIHHRRQSSITWYHTACLCFCAGCQKAQDAIAEYRRLQEAQDSAATNSGPTEFRSGSPNRKPFSRIHFGIVWT